MRDGYLRGSLARPATQRQVDVLAACDTAGGSVRDAAEIAHGARQPGHDARENRAYSLSGVGSGPMLSWVAEENDHASKMDHVAARGRGA